MIKELLKLFGIKEDRADELFRTFFDYDGKTTESVVKDIKSAKILTNEKMFMCFSLGVMVMIESYQPQTTLKSDKKTYIH